MSCLPYFPCFADEETQRPGKLSTPATVSGTEHSSPGSFSFSPLSPAPPQDSASRGGDLPGGPAHPQPAPEDGDLAPCLLLALPPLHQVEAIVDGQRDVPLTHRGVDGAGQQVGLSLQRHLHAIGQQQPQGAVCPDEVAVPDLVCGRGEGQTRTEGGRGVV